MFLLPPLYWFRREAANLLLQTLIRINPKRILEVGFSDAFLTRRISLALPGSSIVAIDTSASSVERAKALRLPNVTFLVDDFFEHRGRYDVVVSMHVFVLFDHFKALDKLRELAPIHLLTLTGRSPFTILHRSFHRFMTGIDVHIVEPQTYRALAERMGFNVLLYNINSIERSYMVLLQKKVPP